MNAPRVALATLDSCWRRGVRRVVLAGAPRAASAATPPSAALTLPSSDSFNGVHGDFAVEELSPNQSATTSSLAWSEDFLGDFPTEWQEPDWGGAPVEIAPPTEPQVISAPPTPDATAVVAKRRAAAAALRAVLLSRQRRVEEARLAFADAFGLDLELDPQGIAGFWDLERGAHEAAVHALEDAGRSRDAMLLRAKVDARYRLRLVRTA